MCGAGMGRTGTILACYLVSLGIPAEDAIRQLIEKRPCSREILNVPGQREAVFEFERRRGDRSTTRRSQDA
jgi:atypical dual specificity phosphatase